MPRTKKVKAYEIDLKFPHRTRDFLFKEDGTDRYTIPELLGFAAQSKGHYSDDFVPNVKNTWETTGGISSSQKWTLENLAADWCPEWEAFNTKFFEWYDSRPDMQEMYAACSKKNWWFYDRQGNHHNVDQAAEKGWLTRPENFHMFERVANGHEGSKYRELKRDVVYDVGDQVMLRRPFVGSYTYDPCYGKGLSYVEARVGMVVEHKDAISRRSRGGKGSRMINVLWITTGEQVQVPERVIKKYREKPQE
jgi:hypothetical protein